MEISRRWAHFMVSVSTVVVSVDVSFSMLIHYSTHIMRLKIQKAESFAILGLVGSNQFLLYTVLSGCVVLLMGVPCPLSLLSQYCQFSEELKVGLGWGSRIFIK